MSIFGFGKIGLHAEKGERITLSLMIHGLLFVKLTKQELMASPPESPAEEQVYVRLAFLQPAPLPPEPEPEPEPEIKPEPEPEPLLIPEPKAKPKSVKSRVPAHSQRQKAAVQEGQYGEAQKAVSGLPTCTH